MPNLTTHKPTLKLKPQTSHIIRQLRQRFLQMFNGVFSKIFVGIHPQHPLRLNRQIIKRPIELLGIEPRPFMLNNSRPHISSNLVAPIRRKAINNENLPSLKRRKSLQAPPDVQLFVLRQDYHRDVCQHKSGTNIHCFVKGNGIPKFINGLNMRTLVIMPSFVWHSPPFSI